MCVVFDHRYVRPVGERLADARDVAGDTGVMHRHHRSNCVVQKRGQVLWVEPQREGLDVAEDDARTLAGEGQAGRGEAEGRYDHGVAGLEVEQHGGHLERRRAGRRQQHLLRRDFLAQQRACSRREGSGRGHVAALHGLPHVLQLATLHGRPVEPDLRRVARSGCLAAHVGPASVCDRASSSNMFR